MHEGDSPAWGCLWAVLVSVILWVLLMGLALGVMRQAIEAVLG